MKIIIVLAIATVLTGGGLMPTAGGWNNLSDFYNDMAKKVALSNAEKELRGNLFVFGSPAESDECFWMDLNKDGKKGDDEKFHRFMLPAKSPHNGKSGFAAIASRMAMFKYYQ